MFADIKCPISCMIFVDPVITADGHTYERSEIERWLKTKKLALSRV